MRKILIALLLSLICQSICSRMVLCKEIQAIKVPVFYATDRQRTGGNLNPTYNCKRRYAEGIEYGQCQVTVPAEVNVKESFELGWSASELKSKKSKTSATKSEYRENSVFIEDVTKRLKKSNRLVVFVHGYNNGMDVAMQRAAELAVAFKSPVVAYCWPSNQKTFDYIKDECNAEWSLPHFRDFLGMLESSFGADHITIVSHSMGNRLVMWALSARADIAKARNSEPSKFADLVMTSPDIDSGTFKNYASKVASNANDSWVLISHRDIALMASKKVHGRNRLGTSREDNVDADWRQPPVIPGLKTIDFTLLDKAPIGHSVQPALISRLANKGVEIDPSETINFEEEVVQPYTIYHAQLRKAENNLHHSKD